MDSRSRSSRTARALPAALAVAAVALVGGALVGGAQAQSGYYSSDPNVTVDLSVLDGGGGTSRAPVGTRPLPAGSATVPDYTSNGLLFPPARPPVSRLDGQYANTTPPALRRPSGSVLHRPMAPRSRLNVAPPPETASVAPPTMPKPAMTKPTVTEPAMPKPAMPHVAATPMPAPAAEPARKPTGSMAAPTTPMAAPAAPAPTPEPMRSASRTPAATPVPPQPAMPKPSAAPAPPVTPPPMPAKAEKPAPVETASRTSATAPVVSRPTDSEVRVLFEKDSAKLPDSARDALTELVGKLQANDNMRLQIEAYAAGTSDTASQARRLSLSRALSVRSYLIEQGVRSTRMDVRALGNKPSDPPAPPDRVDAKLIER